MLTQERPASSTMQAQPIARHVAEPWLGQDGTRAVLKRVWRRCPRMLREMPLRLLAWTCLPWRAGDIQGGVGSRFVVAPLTDASGIGSGARCHLRRDLQAGVDSRAVDLTPLFRTPDTGLCPFPFASLREASADHGPGTVVVHANPPHFLLALLMLGRKFLRHKTVVAYWAWELDDIPSLWRFSLRFVDSVEVPSAFVANAIRRHTTKPVRIVPHPVPEVEPRTRRFAEDGVTRVLFMFDIAGRVSRKNPLAAVAAFRGAFAGRHDVAFTIKVSPASGFEAELETLAKALADDPAITLMTRRLDHAEMASLYRSHDIYLSLHRAEGYGLTIREAMAYGLQVVATGWSGNMDYMHGPRAHAVRFGLVPVIEDRGVFNVPGARWAEPEVEHAAAILQSIDREGRAGTDP